MVVMIEHHTKSGEESQSKLTMSHKPNIKLDAYVGRYLIIVVMEKDHA